MLYLSTKYADIKNNLIYDVEAGFRIFKKSIINNPLYWEIVHDIDKVSEINGDYIKTPFGGTSSDNLSSGCKALLLAVATGTWVNFLEAGDNVINKALSIARTKDLHVYYMLDLFTIEHKDDIINYNGKCIKLKNISLGGEQ